MDKKIAAIQKLGLIIIVVSFSAAVLAGCRHWAVFIGMAAMAFGFNFALKLIKKQIKLRDEENKFVMDVILHDLRNPLSSIMMSASIASEEAKLYPALYDMLALTSKSANFQKRLMDMIELCGRFENGDYAVNYEEINLRQLLSECSKNVQAITYGKGFSIDLPSDGLPDLVKADRELLKDIIMSLMIYAQRYSPKDSAVSIDAQISDGQFKLEICDLGPHIEPSQSEKIFAKSLPYEDRRKIRKGVGLDMYFCRLAVDAMGGKIWAGGKDGKFAVFFTIPQ
ncbi:MAG: ATP-binding protein [Elusimicrobia bacterium]|nr:ATP-binding protein [Elusimicrobiota bacterium]